MKLGNNNLSKQEFKKFTADFNVEQVGRTNSFLYDGKIYGFSVTSTYTPECRQFSEQYSGLVCKLPNGDFQWYEKSELNIGNVSRIGPDGVKYFNVKGTKQ